MIPSNFDWKYYLAIHPDLINAGILNEELAIRHYLHYGKYEKREYFPKTQRQPLDYYLSDVENNNKIIVFMQWYLDDSTQWDRFKCILKNIDNANIDNIHIFCEKGSEDNLKSKPAHWEKVSTSTIEERLTYKYWLNYSYEHYPEYIKILTNSDIYLLDSIKILKSCKFDNRTMYTLTRKDQTENGDIINSRECYRSDSIEINPIYSQDCWIFKEQITNLEKINTNLYLGYENCDRIFKNNLVFHNIDFINLYPDIFCVHMDYRRSKKRPKYNLNLQQDNAILLSKKLDWEYPSTTEKDAYIQHLCSNIKDPSNIYIGFPWATLIDYNLSYGKNIEEIFDKLDIIKIEEANDVHKHTVCQHIQWKKIIPICKKLGITDLHIAHCIKNLSNIDGIKIHPWKLTASNFKHSDIKLNLYNKKYLFSFVGSITNNHLSNIRENLKTYCDTLDSNKYSFIYELKNKWFYQEYIYNYQIKKMPWTYDDNQKLQHEQNRYNEILNSSIFSLCPEGTGPNTIRLWESISIGVIPVIYSDNWEPPQIDKYSWEDFSICIPTNDYEKTLDILLSINDEKLKIMQINAINAYQSFEKMKCY